MWMFGRKAATPSNSAAEAKNDLELDEHASWGVGGPAFLPAAMLDEFSTMLDELPSMLELTEDTPSPQQV